MSTLDTLRDGVSFGRGVFKKMSQPSSANLSYDSPSRATIPQPGAKLNRLACNNKNSINICDSSDGTAESKLIPVRPHTSAGALPYSSSASTSSTNSFINLNVLTLPSITPLDNYFHNLNPVGIVSLHWKHFKAFTTIGEKVNFFNFVKVYYFYDKIE